MQPSTNEGPVAGNGIAAATSSAHPADPTRARAAWEQPIGFSVTLSPDDVQRAIRQLAYRISREETAFRHRTQIQWTTSGGGYEAIVGIPLPADQVARAIKEMAYEVARDRGVAVPVDAIDFQARAEVQWLEGAAAAVVLEV
jgi:hypothetical protein